eukprot:scaffold117006_cov71-Phaeocystis_antarctica.AAC.2
MPSEYEVTFSGPLRLARAPAAAAGRPVGRPPLGRAELPRATRRALRRRKSRAGALPRGHFDHAVPPACTSRLRQPRLKPRQDGAAGRRRARLTRLYVRWHDDVLMRREDPLAVLQLLLQRVRPLVKLCIGAHGAQAAQEAKVRDEDRVLRKLLTHGIHSAEALVARSEEDVVSAAVPLPEVGHGALQVVRSHCHIYVRASDVASLAVDCEDRHKEEVSRVWVQRAHGGIAQERAQEAPVGRVESVTPVTLAVTELVVVLVHATYAGNISQACSGQSHTCQPGLSELERHLVHVDTQALRGGGGLDGGEWAAAAAVGGATAPFGGCLRRLSLSLVRAVHPKRAVPANAEAHAAVASAGAAVLVSVIVHAAPAALPLGEGMYHPLHLAIDLAGAKWRCRMLLRPPRCVDVAKEVTAVGCRMLFADADRKRVSPYLAAHLHTREPVMLVIQDGRIEHCFEGIAVASAGRPMRLRELSAEAGAVPVAMAGDVDAVAAIDAEQARSCGARVADALALYEGRHQMRPLGIPSGYYPLGGVGPVVVQPVTRHGGALHLDGPVRALRPRQVRQATLVVPAAILNLGAERDKVAASAA